MPWHIESDNPDCGGFAVVKDDDGEVEGCHQTEAEAQDQLAALNASEEDSRVAPAREERAIIFDDVDGRASGKPGEGLIFRGHAAVFDRLSLDLGGFRERIRPGAFKKVLDGSPDVHLVWDHDGRNTLARTRGKYLLELREDPRGLHFYANAAPTTYAKDLALLMEGQTIDQGSFAFTVAKGGDVWEIDEEENVTRTIHEVEALYDVTITSQGAYPQTDTSVVQRSLAAFREGHKISTTVEPDDPAGETASPQERGAEQDQREVAEAEPPGTETSLVDDEGEEERVTGLHDLQKRARVELELAKRRLLEAERK